MPKASFRLPTNAVVGYWFELNKDVSTFTLPSKSVFDLGLAVISYCLILMDSVIYYTLHIKDSGAVEAIEEKYIDGKTFPICKLYDDRDFNKLNDILHSTRNYILNERALDVFRESKTIKYELRKAKVLKKERLLGFLKRHKLYEYYEMSFRDEYSIGCYDWINFDKSEIFAVAPPDHRIKITSHQHRLDLEEENKLWAIKCAFEVSKVVFSKSFDYQVDLFKIPYYSWGIYVSDRLKKRLEMANITDIGFAKSREGVGHVWQPYFPTIEFEK